MKHLWALWIATGIIADTFVYVRYGKKHTLSVYVRESLYLNHQTQRRRIGQVLMVSFLSWLGIHLIADALQPLPISLSGDYRRTGG